MENEDRDVSAVVGDALHQFLMGEGFEISNITYTGSNDAAFLVDDFNIKALNEGVEGFNYGSGIMLSSGGYPGDENTSDSLSVAHGTPGDDDLFETAQKAFPGAGSTNDAAVIEFTINVTDPNLDALRTSLVFGSEEYPEFVDSSYVDIAGLYANGVNYANFEATNKPLSIISENLESGVFIDNGVPGNAPYGTEWDGFSKELVVRAPLELGMNTIKIGVADTGDSILDSSLFISDLKLVAGGGTGNGVLSAITPDNSGNVSPTIAAEEITLDGQTNTITGSAEELNGDVVVGFTTNDIVNVSDSFFDSSDVVFSNGSVILDIDTNQDGESDTKLTFAGHEDFDRFAFAQSAQGTSVSLKEEAQVEPEPTSEPTPDPEPAPEPSKLDRFVDRIEDEGWAWPDALTTELEQATTLTRYYALDDVVNPIIRLYTGLLDRAPDQQGLEFWTSELNAGSRLDDITLAFMQSPEVSEALQAMGGEDTAFIENLYERVLSREPDAQGKAYWLDLLEQDVMSRSEIAVEFINSDEYIDNSAPLVTGSKLLAWGTNLDDMNALSLGFGKAKEDLDSSIRFVELHDGLTDRMPDSQAFDEWLASDDSLEQVTNDLLASEGILVEGSTQDSSDGLMAALYGHLLARLPDPTGKQYWQEVMQSSDASAADIALSLIESDEFQQQHRADAIEQLEEITKAELTGFEVSLESYLLG